jgi:hypothetical protein
MNVASITETAMIQGLAAGVHESEYPAFASFAIVGDSTVSIIHCVVMLREGV